MAWTKQDLDWKVIPVAAIKGAGKSPLGEAIKALALFESKWAEAKKHLPGDLPSLPAGKVARFSLRLDQDGEPILKAAAADAGKNSSKAAVGDKFSW